MDEISVQSGRLYISDIDTVAERPLPSDTDRVISTCQDTVTDNVSDDVPYQHFALADDAQSEAEWGGSCAYSRFNMAASSIYASLVVGETVVVHCHVGRNRSVATSAAAIALHEGTTFQDVLNRIRRQRPIADPNNLMRSHGQTFLELRRD
jgi:protein-tyrosine phosphatase